jgi:hypothetical protein
MQKHCSTKVSILPTSQSLPEACCIDQSEEGALSSLFFFGVEVSMSTSRLIVVPTMSSSGCVSDTPSKLDRALAYFMVAHSDQGYSEDLVFSLPKLLQESGSSAVTLVSLLEPALDHYLKPLFDRCKVTVSLDPNESQLAARCTVIVDLQVLDNNYHLSSPVKLILSQGKFQEIVKLNN